MAVPWCWSQSLLHPHSHTYGTMENGALRSGLLCLCQLRRSLWAPGANGDYWQTNPAPLSLHRQAPLLVAALVPGGFSCYPSRMWTCVCWSERMLGYLCTMGWGVPRLLMLHFHIVIQSKAGTGRLLVSGRQVWRQLDGNMEFCVVEGRCGACFDIVLHSAIWLFVLIPTITV